MNLNTKYADWQLQCIELAFENAMAEGHAVGDINVCLAGWSKHALSGTNINDASQSADFPVVPLEL